VPSRQRALAVRLAHTRAQLRAGRSAWASCDVIPWSAWLERCANEGRYGALQGLRRLGGTEEWLLWREAAETACASLELLVPASLADSLRRSAARARDWGMDWSKIITPEFRVLLQARRIFLDRCHKLKAYGVSDWTQVLRDYRAGPAPLLFAGFAGLGGALLERLRGLGGSFWPNSAATALRPSWQSIGCANPTDELRCAARWCREQLERNREARLLVVDIRLQVRRVQAVQAFAHDLHGSEVLGGVGDALYGIEGGQRLSDYGLVRAALDLLQLSAGPLEFQPLAALLRSPYIGCGTSAQRAVLELELRERNVVAANLARLCDLAAAPRFAGGAALTETLRSLASQWAGEPGRRNHAAAWAQEFALRLEAGGWPGKEALGSDELQQAERLRDLLGEFSTLGGSGALLRFAEALELLRALAARTSFEAATPDVPVTLTESIDDPLITYDGIWVAGLSAESWPSPPRADPFVPIAAQRAAGFQPASATGQLNAARQAISNWQRCTPQLVLSWPWADGDVPFQPSKLLGVAARAHGAPVAAPSPDRLMVALRQSARLERRPAESASAWPAGRRLHGGTKLLQLQSLCPFKAVAELRLGAVSVPEPVPGLDRRERGQLLHRALQLVYQPLADSRALRHCAGDPAALDALVGAACERALRELLASRPERLPGALADNERLRLAGRIAAFLRQELVRAEAGDFSIAALEDTHDVAIGGFPLRVRMDRLDRLDDGRLLVLDYKSGVAQAFRPLDERPRQPQLLAYAVLTQGAVAGVAAVHLAPGEVRWRGAAAEPSLLPGLGRPRAPTAPWPELLVQWRRVVENLVRDYAAGGSAVDPLPGACQFCQLPAFCRIDGSRRNEPNPDEEEAGSEAGSDER
jgi:ATP-dependent helicase/nuclease subunit B